MICEASIALGQRSIGNVDHRACRDDRVWKVNLVLEDIPNDEEGLNELARPRLCSACEI